MATGGRAGRPDVPVRFEAEVWDEEVSRLRPGSAMRQAAEAARARLEAEPTAARWLVCEAERPGRRPGGSSPNSSATAVIYPPKPVVAGGAGWRSRDIPDVGAQALTHAWGRAGIARPLWGSGAAAYWLGQVLATGGGSENQDDEQNDDGDRDDRGDNDVDAAGPATPRPAIIRLALEVDELPFLLHEQAYRD